MEALVELIRRVHGLDEVKARPLARSIRRYYKDAAYPTTYAQLRQLLRRDYFDQLPAGTRADLTYNFSKRVPREVILCVEQRLAQVAPNLGAVSEPAFRADSYGFAIGGSFRRARPRSNDIDLMWVGSPRAWAQLVEQLNSTPDPACDLRITEPYQGGASRQECVFLVRLPHQTRTYRVKADIFWTRPSAAAYMLLYITGNFTLNIRMRALARHRGYLLNQYGLFALQDGAPASRSVRAARERQIFEKLGAEWLAPTERDL